MDAQRPERSPYHIVLNQRSGYPLAILTTRLGQLQRSAQSLGNDVLRTHWVPPNAGLFGVHRCGAIDAFADGIVIRETGVRIKCHRSEEAEGSTRNPDRE